MSDRYLIINADDYGLCTETNEAVEQLFNEGRITSATVMAPAAKSVEAIRRAVNNNNIKMGLHITLNSDYEKDKWSSISPRMEVASLLDDEGKFNQDVNSFYLNAKEEEVKTELEAQYRFAAEVGYRPTHADSHCGTLYGLSGRSFLKQAFGLCVEYKLPFRFPRSRDFIVSMFGGNLPEEILQLHTAAVKAADSLGIALPDNILSNPFSMKEIKSYENLKDFYLNAIRNLKEGVTEIFLHPSKENVFYMSSSAEWQKRIWEYQFLLDEDMMKTIRQEGIQLVSWDNAPFGLYRHLSK
jgi:predicted glycoside hydrolase/deacetylase ChbG (UPF0249 family)